MDDAHNSELIRIVLDNLQPVLDSSLNVIQSEYEKTGKLRTSSPIERTPVEIYDIEVFQAASSIASAISRLWQAKTYIENYPGDMNGKGTAHTQYDWIQYHYAFFISTVVSISDLALILVNYVFRLGNPPKHCRQEIILKNEWVRETEISKRFGELDKLIRPYREFRNQLLHRGRMPKLPNNSEDSLLDYISFYNVLLQSKPDVIPPELVNKAWQKERPQISKLLQVDIRKLNVSINAFFNELLPYYKAIRIKLDSQTGT
ncbi:MAG: Cthe_2314 family HEPN domain-containing protein [Candidatus Roizmanbacteria bacterium]|nr:Cthe_2314 family HEPN domain-containing protein [Candidatus Roizmanbacteria bacterium]